ncbi:MAG: PilZ domain-containing protein [Pseudomonadota bacterium]
MFHRAHRRPSAMHVILRVGTGAFRSGVLDVSAGGAKIRTAARLSPGDHVVLETARQDLMAQVVWTKDGRTGLRFSTPLAARNIADLTGARVRAEDRSGRRWLYDPSRDSPGPKAVDRRTM